MKLLVIEDEEDIREFLKVSFGEECFAVDTTENGPDGLSLAKSNDYDLIIMDNLLPGKTGLEICEELRRSGKNTPVLVISVKSDVDNKVKLLNTGADDYVTKPFSFTELLARVRAILRRPTNFSEEVIKIDNLTIDVPKQSVTRGNKSIYLTRKEFTLLEYLARNRGFVLSRGMIMEHVWNSEADPFSNTIEAHILNLRKKIDIGFKKKLIHSVPGRGYKIEAPS